MEPLHKRADGISETPSGDIAVVMKHRSGGNADVSWFSFRAGAYDPPVRIEWPTGSALVILEPTVAHTLLRNGWAHNLPDELVERYALAREDFLKASAASAPKTAPAAPPPPPFLNPAPEGESDAAPDGAPLAKPDAPADNTKTKKGK